MMRTTVLVFGVLSIHATLAALDFVISDCSKWHVYPWRWCVVCSPWHVMHWRYNSYIPFNWSSVLLDNIMQHLCSFCEYITTHGILALHDSEPWQVCMYVLTGEW